MDVSCNLGFLIIVVFKLRKLILSCSNLIISLSCFNFLLEIILPFNKNNSFLSTIPFSAIMVVLSTFESLDEKFFKLFPVSCKKIF